MVRVKLSRIKKGVVCVSARWKNPVLLAWRSWQAFVSKNSKNKLNIIESERRILILRFAALRIFLYVLFAPLVFKLSRWLWKKFYEVETKKIYMSLLSTFILRVGVLSSLIYISSGAFSYSLAEFISQTHRVYVYSLLWALPPKCFCKQEVL